MSKCLHPEAQPPYVFANFTFSSSPFCPLIRHQAWISPPALPPLRFLASQSSPPLSSVPQTLCPSPRHPSCPLSAVTSVHQSMIAAANEGAVHRSNRPMGDKRCGPLVAASHDGQEQQEEEEEERRLQPSYLACNSPPPISRLLERH